MSVSIDYLKNHPQYLGKVAGWIFGEWGHLLAGATPEFFRERFATRMNDEKIPLTLIALEDGEPAGTASILVDDMQTRPDLTPWLAGVFVSTEMRNRGIGAALVGAIEKTAKRLGIPKLYLFTHDRRSFYERLGWVHLEGTEYRGEHVEIMSKELRKERR